MSAGQPVSAIDAANAAVEHTRRALFPFRLDRWLLLGVLAFLDQCGRGGGGGSVPNPGGFGGGGKGGGGGPDLAGPLAWIGDHVAIVVLITIGVLMLVVLLSALVLWVNSRANFMYMDAVATGRVEFGRPWREHAARANSLFAVRFGLAMLTLMVVLVLLAVVAGGGFAVYRGGLGGGVALALGLLVLLPTFLLVILFNACASLLLRDVVPPLQWKHDLSCSEGLRRAIALVRAQPGAFVLYVVLKVAFAMAAAVVMLVVGCATCCIGFLPVIAQTLLQPLFFFERAWSLCLMRQLGCDVFVEQAPAGAPILEA